MQQRAKAVGFEYPDLDGAVADLDDEIRELKEDFSGHELGDVLFAAVNVARKPSREGASAHTPLVKKTATAYATTSTARPSAISSRASGEGDEGVGAGAGHDGG